MTFLSKPITYKGKHYPSRGALAKAYGLTCEVLRYRLLHGIALESPTKVPLELLSERPKEP